MISSRSQRLPHLSLHWSHFRACYWPLQRSSAPASWYSTPRLDASERVTPISSMRELLKFWFSKTLPWQVFSNLYKLYSWVVSICRYYRGDYSVGVVCLHDTGDKSHSDKAFYHWGTWAAAGLLPQVWTPARFKLSYSFINVYMCVGWRGAYGDPKWTSGVFFHDAQLDVYWGGFSLNRSSPIPPSLARHSATKIHIFEFMANFPTFSQSLHSYSYGACGETCNIVLALRRLR